MFTASVLLQLTIDGITRGAMYGLMAAGLALIFGIVRVINMAHGEFFMLGGYAMYFAVVALGLPAPVGILFAAAAMFVFGMALEQGLIAPLRNRLGERWLVDGYVLTIGVMVVLQNLALIGFGPRERGIATLWPGRLEIGDIVISNERLVILIGAILAMAALGLFLTRTNLGRAIRATAEHPDAARVMGINTNRIYAITFGLGSALAGAVGGLLLSIYPAFPTVGGDILLKAFVVVIMGGLGNILAGIAAGFVLGFVETFGVALTSATYRSILIYGIFVGVLLLRPQGLFGKAVQAR